MKRILFVDDDPNMLAGLRRMLRPMEGTWEMVFLDSASSALDALEASSFDALVTDLQMPGLDGLQLLRRVRREEHLASVAVVVLTGTGCESLAVRAMKLGAQDYLVKGGITVEAIKRTIESATREVADACLQEAQVVKLSERLAEANLDLAKMSRLDPLTLVFNRRAWEEAAEFEQERLGPNFAIIMIDIDYFKRLNDAIGHQGGDECLTRVAGALRVLVRGTDIVGRYGGEEFIVMCPGIERGIVETISERIRAGIWDLDLPHPDSSAGTRVTVSVGSAYAEGNDWPEVARRADAALYAAKRAGRNQARSFDANMNAAVSGNPVS